MTDLRTAAQQFVTDYENGDLGDLKHYARALRKALEQPEQEPVALQKLLHQVICGDFNADNTDDLRLALAARKDFAALQLRREWRSLSEEERADILFPLTAAGASDMECARAIEQALRSKNHE